MTKLLLPIVLGLVAILSPLPADDITLSDGTVLKNAKIVQRDDATKTVTISFSGGITQVHSEMLPVTPETAPSPTTPNPMNTSTPVSGPATAPSPTLPSHQQNASDYNAQGFDKFTKGDVDGAIADFNQAIALDPKLAEAYNRRGNANRAKGNTDAAIADYQQAITVDPNYANPHNGLGTFKVVKGDFDGAIADFNQAIALDPKLAKAYINRGIAKRNKGDLDGAVADFKQGVALDPKLAPHPPPDYDSAQEEQSFVDLVRKKAPRMGETISSFQLKGDTLVVTMTDGYNSSSYQSRLEFAQAFYQLWAKFHNDKAETYVSPICMTDAGGTQVGGMNASGVWVKPGTENANKQEAKKPAVFVIGTVFQKVEDGVILTGLPSGAAFPGQDVPKGMRMKAVAQFERVFIKGYRGAGVDGALVEVTAYPDGTFSYDTVLGSSSTIRAYTEVSQ